MIPVKSKATTDALAVHNAIMHVSEVYGRQLEALAQENAALRAELAAANGRIAAQKKEEPIPGPPPEVMK